MTTTYSLHCNAPSGFCSASSVTVSAIAMSIGLTSDVHVATSTSALDAGRTCERFAKSRQLRVLFMPDRTTMADLSGDRKKKKKWYGKAYYSFEGDMVVAQPLAGRAQELRGDLQRLRFEATGLSEPLVPEAGNELSDNLGGAVSLSHQKGVERVEGSNVPLILINAGKSDWRDKNSRSLEPEEEVADGEEVYTIITPWPQLFQRPVLLAYELWHRDDDDAQQVSDRGLAAVTWAPSVWESLLLVAKCDAVLSALVELSGGAAEGLFSEVWRDEEQREAILMRFAAAWDERYAARVQRLFAASADAQAAAWASIQRALLLNLLDAVAGTEILHRRTWRSFGAFSPRMAESPEESIEVETQHNYKRPVSGHVPLRFPPASDLRWAVPFERPGGPSVRQLCVVRLAVGQRPAKK
ncbi:hypothetical protein AK812_SmicGene1185 [Symbiodinium microadriaticum]|uniref:Uncharacterized protein n=1 Tax=Symbiodinium microadriaticum TaxID=2951 RepID=A0A1Q9F4Y1_SYMMI|nr:hypothetical protein AK812_SmicGene1185 [Symbiodinium microadriaticum]